MSLRVYVWHKWFSNIFVLRLSEFMDKEFEGMEKQVYLSYFPYISEQNHFAMGINW